MLFTSTWLRAKSAGTSARGTGPPSSRVDAELACERCEASLVRPRSRVGAVQPRRRAPASAAPREDRLEALRGRVAAEHEDAQLLVRRRVGARELVDVDAVADAVNLPRAQRETSARRRDDRRAELLRRTDDGVRLPVRVPEDERDPARPYERRGEDGVERDHVRDDTERPRAQLACKCALESRAALELRRAPNSCTRTFAGTTPGTAVSQSTTSSSTRSASARTIGTVAARTGSSGSSFCVAKTSRRIRRSRGRRG